MIEVGMKAPAWTLPDENEKLISLADYAGRWLVLYFYPRDDTPGCTIQACDFSEGIADFQNIDAAVLGCSPDDPHSHRRFISKHKLRITLLSDIDHRVMERYGAWGEKNMYGRVTVGVIRSTVIIDPSGRIAHRWKKVQAKGHVAAVRRKLDELRSL